MEIITSIFLYFMITHHFYILDAYNQFTPAGIITSLAATIVILYTILVIYVFYKVYEDLTCSPSASNEPITYS